MMELLVHFPAPSCSSKALSLKHGPSAGPLHSHYCPIDRAGFSLHQKATPQSHFNPSTVHIATASLIYFPNSTFPRTNISSLKNKFCTSLTPTPNPLRHTYEQCQGKKRKTRSPQVTSREDNGVALSVKSSLQSGVEAISSNGSSISGQDVGDVLPAAPLFPPFLPPGIQSIQDPDARAMAARMVRLPVQVPSLSSEPVMSSLVGPAAGVAASSDPACSPILLLHGFDGSCLEWRKAFPLLERSGAEVWAPCVLGWGFGGGVDAGVTSYSVEAKRAHLHALWRTHIGRPAVLVGASLGGAVALDFALAHPEAVEKVVLIDAQAFADGTGKKASLPRFLAYAGVEVLRSPWLRLYATKLTFYDLESWNIDDQMRVGALHCRLPGWADAQVDFMLSGGYNIASRVPEVKQEALVIWGENDKVLDKALAQRFLDELPCAKLEMIPDCGHIPHVEKADLVAKLILDFVSSPAA